MRKLFFILIPILSLVSCKKSKPKPPLSSEKEIVSFGLKVTSNPGLPFDINGTFKEDSIILALPANAPVTNLVPSITFKGSSIQPGPTTAQNFTNPIIYTVTAEDNSTKKYVVAVRRLSSEKTITSFSFKASDNTGILTSDANGIVGTDTIKVTIDGFNALNLTPTITHKGKTISPSSGSSSNFTKAVDYTVTAEDGSTKKYTVVVESSGSLFVGSQDKHIYCLDAVSGKVKWKYLTFGLVPSSPTVVNGIVYIGGGDGYLYALNASNGSLVWKTKVLGGIGSAIHVTNNAVYFSLTAASDSSPSIYALDASTGTIKWGYVFGGTDLLPTNVTAANGKVYFGNFGSGVRCVDAGTGNLLWRYNIGIVRDNPAVVNGTVYIGGESSMLAAIDATTGAEKWRLPGVGIGSSPTIHNGVLYNGGLYLYARDPINGNLKWQYQGVGNFGSPSIDNGIIYIADNRNYIYAVNANDGTQKWRYHNEDLPVANQAPNVVAAHGVAFVYTLENKLQAMDARTGNVLWVYPPGTVFLSTPCIVDSKGVTFHSSTSGAQQ